MSTPKTLANDASVTDFINALPDEAKRKDSFALLELFTKVTGEQPKMWGPAIIGFGQYHYVSERSKQEADWPLTAFSPRKQNLSIYVMNEFDDYTDLLKDLGKHKSSTACLYVNKLSDVDVAVLERLIARSYAAMQKHHA